jgi:hypothetical protein
MKPIHASILLVCAVLFAGPAPTDDPSRVADIADPSGTVTRVTGLHYCYEEEEGDELFINKFDNFFIRRGEAVIQADFQNLARVEFLEKAEDRADKHTRKARILTRAGNEVEGEILCHGNAYIKGNVALGEFRLDMDKIQFMEFALGADAEPRGFETHLFPKAESPGGALPLILAADGSLTREGDEEPLDADSLKKALAPFKHKVFLRVDPRLPYATLRQHLHQLQEAGARCILLGP